MHSETWENVNVLVEPSLLVDERTLWKVANYLHQYRLDVKKEQFFVPSKFVQLLSDAERNLKDILFFQPNAARMVDLKELRDALEKEVVARFTVRPSDREQYGPFRESLLEETKSEIITEVLFEEWVFLQQKSWIISRIKKSFTYLIKAGAVSVEMGKKTLDLAVRKTLKKSSQSIITNADRLRSVAKWIAVAGEVTLPIFDPIAGAIGGTAAGFFLLIDPKC
jgi:hypothetical protein